MFSKGHAMQTSLFLDSWAPLARSMQNTPFAPLVAPMMFWVFLLNVNEAAVRAAQAPKGKPFLPYSW